MHTAVLPGTVDQPTTDEQTVEEFGWNVVVWNDPVNLMDYVVYVFRKLFGYSEEKATKLMLEVHNDGRSVVNNAAARGRPRWTSTHCSGHGLWATLEKA